MKCLALALAFELAACGERAAPDASATDARDASASEVACDTPWMCSGQCVDLRSDPNNCGACGTACGSGCECRRLGCFHADSGTPCGL